MKMSLTITRTILLATSALIACSSPSDPRESLQFDASQSGCDFDGFNASTQLAQIAEQSQTVIYTGENSTQRLLLVLRFLDGAMTGPHQFTFTGERFPECHTCLTIRRDCVGDLCPDGTKFIAQSGTVNFETIGGSTDRLQGTLSNLKFSEYTHDPSTGQSALVPNGKTWCVDQYSFDQAFTILEQ